MGTKSYQAILVNGNGDQSCEWFTHKSAWNPCWINNNIYYAG
jgi:hypothetical protein